MKVCSKLCNDCPFSNKSIKGFLGGYDIETLLDFFNNDILFPCHKTVKLSSERVGSVQQQVLDEELPVCRGYLECMVRSCKVPRSTDLNELRSSVKENLTSHSMSMHEFIIHHKRV